MHVFRQLFQEYVKGSFHVALMALVFCELTFNQWGLSSSYSARALVFLLTFLAYNGIRYFPFTNVKHELAHFYFVLFTAAFFYGGFLFVGLIWQEQLLLLFCFLFCLVYAIPLPRRNKNLRNRYGVKIFIVALCWTLFTAVFPLLKEDYFSWAHYLFFAERFLLVFIATLPFEIRDSSTDDSNLGTIPQVIGRKNTQFLGYALLLFVGLLLVVNSKFTTLEAYAMGSMLLAYGIALYVIRPSSSKNSTLFWVEAIPVLGFLLYCLKPF